MAVISDKPNYVTPK